MTISPDFYEVFYSAITFPVIIKIALGIWVYYDAKFHCMFGPVLWALGAFAVTIVVLPIYLVVHITKQFNITNSGSPAPPTGDYDKIAAEKTKSVGVLVAVIIAFCVAMFADNYKAPSTEKPAAVSQITQSRYTYGLLKENVTWTDDYDDVYHMTALSKTSRVHRNDKPTKIEIWNLDIVTADGQRNRNIVMIYFLEGRYKGRWGYTIRAYTEI